MQLQVVTCIRNKGIGQQSKRAFDFLVVGGLMTTARGVEFVEVMLDGDTPIPEPGKKYDLEVSFYPDREKRLAFKVVGLRATAPVAKAA